MRKQGDSDSFRAQRGGSPFFNVTMPAETTYWLLHPGPAYS